MDRIARALELDPLQLRLKNAYRDGDMKAHRKIAEGTALIEVIQKAAELVGHELPDGVPGDVVDGGDADGDAAGARATRPSTTPPA